MAKEVTVDFNARLGKFEKAINSASSKLQGFQKFAKGQSRSMENAFVSLGAKLAGAFAGLAVANQFYSVNEEFDRLQASLVTVTGSAEEATTAFDGIQKFATETPFSVQEITASFIKLKALGLDPTDEALRSFGNTASAMGKTLDQFVEAVADAVTGEFERLKEFGIKASSQGDKVAFTFQGIKTTIGKNAAEIEEYLRGIGNVQFAGAMEKQMDTIGGAVSNLGVAFDLLLKKIGELGVNDALKSFVNGLTQALNTVVELGKPREFLFGENLAEAQARIEEINTALAKPTGSTRAWARETAVLQSELRRLEALDPYAAQDRALNRIVELEKTLGNLRREGGRTNKARAKSIATALQDERDALQAATDAIESYNNQQAEGVESDEERATSLSKLRDALTASNTAGATFAKTLELFKEDATPVFDEMASSANKVSNTYKAIGEAMSASRLGKDDEAAAAIERASGAILKLEESGEVAQHTLNSMKQSLKGAFEEKPPETKIEMKVDEEGIISYTDEATKKLQAEFEKHPPIVRVKVEVDAEEAKKEVEAAVGGMCEQAEKTGGRS